MRKCFRESKAKLAELVELASKGEDVLISVRGKVKAASQTFKCPKEFPPGLIGRKNFDPCNRSIQLGAIT